MATTTSLYGTERVRKTHPRIVYRGQLDALQCEVTLLCTMKIATAVYDELNDIQTILCALMRAEVLDELMERHAICGRSLQALHELSHNPVGGHKFLTPDCGELCARLNLLRAHIRQLEITAIDAMPERSDIHSTLNMLSGAVYTIMLEQLN